MLEFLDAVGKPLKNGADVGRNIDALLAMETRGETGLDGILELFAAGAASADAGGGLGLGHGFRNDE